MVEHAARRQSRGLAFVLVGSFALKLGLLLWVGDIRPFRDEILYLHAGDLIARGEPIAYPDALWDEAHAPPIYPYFIAAVTWLGGGAFEAKLVQVVLSTLSAYFVFGLARTWFGGGTGLVAAAMFAFYPTLVAFTHYLWPETVFLFLLTLGLWLVARASEPGAPASRLVAGGLVLGAATMTRAVMMYVTPLIGVWAVVAARDRAAGLRNAVLIAVGFVVALAPLELRLYQKYGGFLPVCSSSAYVWYVSYNYMPPLNADWGFHDDRNVLRQFLMARERGEDPRQPVKGLDPLARTREERARALQFARAHPRLMARWTAMRVVEYLNPTSFVIRHVRLGLYERMGPGAPPRGPVPHWLLLAVIALTAGSYAALSVLAVLGMFGLARSAARDLAVMAIPLVVALHGITLGVSRYRLILIPFLVVMAAAFLTDLRGCRGRLSTPARRVAVLATLAALLAAWSVHLDKL